MLSLQVNTVRCAYGITMIIEFIIYPSTFVDMIIVMVVRTTQCGRQPGPGGRAVRTQYACTTRLPDEGGRAQERKKM